MGIYYIVVVEFIWLEIYFLGRILWVFFFEYIMRNIVFEWNIYVEKFFFYLF